MTMQEERQARIEAWMTTVARDGGVERYDDLHIDQIDPKWAAREHWLQAGLEAYCIGVRLRDTHRLDLTAALALSLVSGERRRGVTFKTPNELQAELDWSPPSLYLFHREREPWIQPGAGAIPLDAVAVFHAPEARDCYYMEFKQTGSAEYSRSVFLPG